MLLAICRYAISINDLQVIRERGQSLVLLDTIQYPLWSNAAYLGFDLVDVSKKVDWEEGVDEMRELTICDVLRQFATVCQPYSRKVFVVDGVILSLGTQMRRMLDVDRSRDERRQTRKKRITRLHVLTSNVLR